MIPISIKQLQVILDAESIGISDSDTMINSVSTDTREIKTDSVFLALTGNHFDGHDFAIQAVELGAKLVIVSRQISDHLPQLIVKDVLKALGILAHWVRKQVNARIVALTGSSGKTSVKEMTAAILKQCGQTRYTQGNLNNEIGVPLTLLQLTPDDQFAVIELGANHSGEIAYTVTLVEPECALINNIAAAHLEGFGSLEGVAKAKCEIFQGLPKAGKAFLNIDSHVEICVKQLKDRQLSFFSLLSEKADYYARNIVESPMQTSFVLHTPDAQFAITLPFIGLHNVSNAIAASALALSVGASQEAIVKGLSNLQPVKGRLYPILLNDSQLIFDDTYNAN
ncbi:MAG: UDP-N-acetylmuramoyl-tripeptide--D-alanyl-D-alanine ligase, partial [Candidatus Schmidhempelia sp.]|nr:UDP-N-acetylmuramoyl-tripeptide--D-alanyl-D-alanine ligase [Candidatus Schmidhempelia sp.]